MTPDFSKPLTGRVALVTGVSRRVGIGYALAKRLLDDGASVFVQSWSEHDREQPWAPGEDESAIVLAELLNISSEVAGAEVDLADPMAPSDLVAKVIDRFGALDILVCNHARSSDEDLMHVTAHELDMSFAVNTRATILLTQAFARLRTSGRKGGRVILFTSGQHLGAMPGELGYVASKGAVHQITATLADEVATFGITVNTINPGPTDTGWASPEELKETLARFRLGRWGEPDDAARLVAWLVSDEAAWITGQIFNSEGGFRR